MSRRFFYRELLNMLLCTVLPLLCISVLFLALTTRSIVDNNDEGARVHLVQVADQMDMIVNELDSLNVTFSVNQEILTAMTRSMVFHEGSWLNALNRLAKNYLTPSVASRNYIHSLYLYMENDRKLFLTDSDGAVQLDAYYDSSWYPTYLAHADEKYHLYSELRAFRQYSFEKKDTQVITLYRPLFLRDGVVVLNLYKDFFDAQLTRQSASSSQLLLACNLNGEVMMRGGDEPDLDAAQLRALCSRDLSELSDCTLGDTRYHVVRSDSAKTSWVYLSLRSYRDLYSPLYSMVVIVTLCTIGLFLICVTLSFRHARRSVGNVRQIIQLLDAAERHEVATEAVPHGSSDIYNHILHGILRNFTEQNNLLYQLQQKKNAARELELTALRAQINPHFLFNTLKTICWMSIEQNNGQNEVSRMIEDMTEILEYSMDSSDDMVPLSQEIQNTRAYTHIQSVRYKNRFSIEWRYPESVERFYTIKLVIQPLIENSILHGIRWEENQMLSIVVSICETEHHISIRVEDDGVGITPEQLQKIRSRLGAQTDEGHIGLYSCNRRLCLTFGAEYALQIESAANRTCVSMRFPKIAHDGDPLAIG